jgi:hypothetical protein
MKKTRGRKSRDTVSLKQDILLVQDILLAQEEYPKLKFGPLSKIISKKTLHNPLKKDKWIWVSQASLEKNRNLRKLYEEYIA